MTDIWDDTGMDELPEETREERNDAAERRMLAREKWVEPTDVPNRWPSCRDEPDEDGEDNLTDAEADSQTLASAGHGTDEDYGYYGEGEDL